MSITTTTLGFTYHQSYELELVEPRQGGDFYARDLNPDGEIFLHHFGFLVHDLDLQTARLTSQGVPLLVRGRIHSGPLTPDFSYLDTRGEFGLITELICMRFLGLHTRIPPPLARYMGRRQTKKRQTCAVLPRMLTPLSERSDTHSRTRRVSRRAGTSHRAR